MRIALVLLLLDPGGLLAQEPRLLRCRSFTGLLMRGGLGYYSTTDLAFSKSNYGRFRIGDFVDQNGFVYLFRAIGSQHSEGKTGLFSTVEGSYSYTLDPYIANAWGHLLWKLDRNVLISRHHVTDEITTGVMPTVFGTRKLSDQIGNQLKSHTVVFGHLAQVNVPYHEERIIASIPLREFNAGLGECSATGCSITELVDYLVR